ncbi:gas vesicle protein [Streptomyces sp. SID11385]|nr:gas vesicle protein [Streptomyces sp. SID11385]
MAEARGTRRATRSGGTKSTGSTRPKAATGTSRPKSTTRSTAKGTAKSTAKSGAKSPPRDARKSTAGRAPAKAPAASRLREIATEAAEELAALIGHEAEGVSAVRRGEAGWRVEVDVVEVLRIPDTTSLLATYEMTLDEEGRLVEYRRLRRFRRGWADG